MSWEQWGLVMIPRLPSDRVLHRADGFTPSVPHPQVRGSVPVEGVRRTAASKRSSVSVSMSKSDIWCRVCSEVCSEGWGAFWEMRP